MRPPWWRPPCQCRLACVRRRAKCASEASEHCCDLAESSPYKTGSRTPAAEHALSPSRGLFGAFKRAVVVLAISVAPGEHQCRFVAGHAVEPEACAACQVRQECRLRCAAVFKLADRTKSGRLGAGQLHAMALLLMIREESSWGVQTALGRFEQTALGHEMTACTAVAQGGALGAVSIRGGRARARMENNHHGAPASDDGYASYEELEDRAGQPSTSRVNL